MASSDSVCCVPINDAKGFVTSCFTSAGASELHANDMADLMITADTMGHFSHGLNRLEIYLNHIQSGLISTKGEPQVMKENAATALVDGNNLLGAAVGKFCMKLAIKKAKENGVGCVVAHQSNHYGIAGYYSLMAADEGFIGFSFTNTAPGVFSTRAKVKTLGTNAMACAAPALNGDSFALDMATSTVAFGKVDVCHRKGESMPSGWEADKDGRETNKPADVLNGGGLFPLGGSEESGGYKGYGLAMMVEVMCGVLSGGTYGRNVRKRATAECTEGIADLSQSFIAVDPSAFCPGFDARLQDFMDTQRNLEPSDPNKPVLVAGDPERQNIKRCDELGGIPYPKRVVDHMNEVGKRFKVSAIGTIKPKQ